MGVVETNKYHQAQTKVGQGIFRPYTVGVIEGERCQVGVNGHDYLTVKSYWDHFTLQTNIG